MKKYAMQRADEKLGGALNAKQIKAVEELHGIVYSEVKGSIGADDANYDEKVTQRFGKNVGEKEKKRDQELREKGQLVEFLKPEQQKELKLSFRNGLAHRWTDAQNKPKGQLEIYDTKKFGDAHFSEYGASLYAMNTKGAIYVYGKETLGKNLKHSSLLAGASVLCAGTIRIEDGKVKWLTGRSGHYLPTVDNIVSLLERLRQYQVDLKGVIVFRENFTKPFTNATGQPGKNYEPCQALELLEKRVWPGEEPNSMHVE